MNRREAIRLAKGAAAWLYNDDPDFVDAGCSDVSEVIAQFLSQLGVDVKVLYGWARWGRGEKFMHAWLEIGGERLDPVLWVFRNDLSKYSYKVEPNVAEALKVHDPEEEQFRVDELERERKKGRLRPEKPEIPEAEPDYWD